MRWWVGDLLQATFAQHKNPRWRLYNSKGIHVFLVAKKFYLSSIRKKHQSMISKCPQHDRRPGGDRYFASLNDLEKQPRCVKSPF